MSNTTWIKDFYTKSGNLTARIYKVSTDRRFFIMYNNCKESIDFDYPLHNGERYLRVGEYGISLNLKGTIMLEDFFGKLRKEYDLPLYISREIYKYTKYMEYLRQ